MPTLHWIGKDKVINHHREVPFKVLEHAYGFSAEQGKADAPTGSGNMVVHGDNLEALKALLPRYEGRVKCIYIDPPYNTGNEGWVYNDNVNDPKIRRWLHQVVGKEGEDLSRHDKWLCMMYPRLVLLHKLLAEDGVIFISIDDIEAASLRLVLDEIFGNRNFIAQFVWKSRPSEDVRALSGVSNDHEYVLAYGNPLRERFAGVEKDLSKFRNPDDDPRGPWRSADMTGLATITQRPNLHYPITDLITNRTFDPPEKGWRFDRSGMERRISEGRIIFPASASGRPRQKIFMNETASTKSLGSVITEVTTMDGTRTIQSLFSRAAFDFPKPPSLVELLVGQVAGKNAIILDSFAGSGTTAHAVLNLNKQDGGNRKFILVEMEDYAETITAERVRRVMQGYGSEKKKVAGTGGTFDYYTLGPRLFDAHHNLNEEVAVEKIREYVWYTETRTDIHEIPGQARNDQRKKDTSYLLGMHEDTAYYFVYEKERLTVLDYDTLALLKTKAAHYVIYADNCILPQRFLEEHHITFKKIPRDISRF